MRFFDFGFLFQLPLILAVLAQYESRFNPLRPALGTAEETVCIIPVYGFRILGTSNTPVHHWHNVDSDSRTR